MRKTIYLGMGLALSLATAAVAVAQGPGGPPPGGEMRRGPGGPGMFMDQLFQGITLSDAQKTQIHQLFTADSAKREAGRAAMRAQMDSMRSAYQSGDTAKAAAIRARGFAAMQQHMQDETNAVRNVLTADQRVQFDKNVAAMKERMQQRGGPGGMGGPPGGRDHQVRGSRGLARGLFR
jgi:protein CpxP